MEHREVYKLKQKENTLKEEETQETRSLMCR